MGWSRNGKKHRQTRSLASQSMTICKKYQLLQENLRDMMKTLPSSLCGVAGVMRQRSHLPLFIHSTRDTTLARNNPVHFMYIILCNYITSTAWRPSTLPNQNNLPYPNLLNAGTNCHSAIFVEAPVPDSCGTRPKEGQCGSTHGEISIPSRDSNNYRW